MSDRSVDDAAPASDVRNPASLLNHDRLIDDEAIVCTSPFVPRYVNPCVSDGRKRDPKYPDVEDAYVDESSVVEAFPVTLIFPPNSELPATSNIFPVVDVALAPNTNILVVSVG